MLSSDWSSDVCSSDLRCQDLNSRRGEQMTRRKYVVGNWKMNGLSDALAEAQAIFAAAADHPGVDIAICPPFTLIGPMVAAAPGGAVGGQDCNSAEAGAVDRKRTRLNFSH